MFNFAKSVISNQRPASAIEFKQNQNTKKKTTKIVNEVCDPCKYHEYKNSIDWKDREKQLKELCDKYRSKMIIRLFSSRFSRKR